MSRQAKLEAIARVLIDTDLNKTSFSELSRLILDKLESL